MTLNEYKKDALIREIAIVEQKVILPPLGIPAVRIIVNKVDTDGLNWSSEQYIDFGIYGLESHLDRLRYSVNTIENAMYNRHATNPNQCQHDIVNVAGKIRCKNCMANLGDTVQVNLTFN